MSTIDSPALRPMNGEETSFGSGGDGTGTTAFRLPRRVFVGQIVTPESRTSLRLINRGIIGVGSSGIIRFVEDLDEVEKRTASSSTSAKEDLRPSHPTPRRGAALASGPESSASVDAPQEEDRSATPVNIPGRSRLHTISPHDDATLTLPPPAMDAEQADGARESYLSEQYAKEQKVIESIVGGYGWRLQECETVLLSGNSFLCPGFIDTHVHAPQVPNLGRGQQYELLDWLENITFPREKKFEDPLYARKTYESVIQRMLDSGTTCAAIYATIHEEATMILAHICNEKGMRAFVGKCMMDRNAPVDYKEKNSSASMESTKRFIRYCRTLAPYGTPKTLEEDRSDPLLSSGSAEMDESIARLSATMKSIMDDNRGEGKDERTNPRMAKVMMQSDQKNDSPTHNSASHLDSAQRPSRGEEGRPSPISADEPELNRRSSRSSRVSGTSNSTRGHTARQSGSASASGSGYGTPSKREMDKSIANALVQPILTPRFAIACSDALLASISALMSRDGTLRVQTHLSENAGEIAFTKELFPFCQTYTDVYDHFSLLTPRTILAHAIHLSEGEMSLIAKRKSGISHCPTSNLNLRSGASRLGELLNRGVKVGLGTDMSGGFGMSMLTAIRDTSIVAKVLQFPSKDENYAKERSPDVSAGVACTHKTGEKPSFDFCQGPLPIATLFFLATLGGAEVCDIADRVGSLETGKEFDAILFNCDNSNPNLYIEEDDDLEAKVEKTLFCADDRNIASVFVRGRVVGGSAPIG